MTVQVVVCNAAQLLSGSRLSGRSIDNRESNIEGTLTIPEYQRPYCWQDSQLHSLLNDIQTQTKRHPELPYYLGSLILHQENGRLNIIDGQQRITTLALIDLLQKSESNSIHSLTNSLTYEHPVSQKQIKHNLKWLKNYLGQRPENAQTLIDFNSLQFTVVVTQSEDDAYRFFETQNTGGVRLGGPDIIKAHHLRAVKKTHQPAFAKQWESLGSIDRLVSALLKGRYWQGINHQELPTHTKKKQVRDTIVREFAQLTSTGGDIAFGRTQRCTDLTGELINREEQQGYDVRQPLNAGVNTIRYLSYFQHLHQHYWLNPVLPHLKGYQEFIAWLKNIEGCGYLQGLYESCLLLYISQFGESELEHAAKKIFRVVYSRRVSNQKSVREISVPAFVKDYPVLDWISLSYTHEQCLSFFDKFKFTVNGNNLNKNSVKRRFIDEVNKQFDLELQMADYQAEFADALSKKIIGHI